MACIIISALIIQSILVLCVQSQSIQVRLDQQETALNRLTARLSDLNDQLDTALKAQKASNENVDRLTWLIEDKYGNGCPKKYSRCGDSAECVSNLAICDGTKDCQNGYDENERSCEFPFEMNSLFKGYVVYNNCMLTDRSTASDYWMITKTKNIPYFQSSRTVWWTYFPRIVNRYKIEDGELEGIGLYFHGARQMLGYFNAGNRLIGRVQSIGSKNVFIVRGYRASMLEEGPPCFLHFYIRTTLDEL